MTTKAGIISISKAAAVKIDQQSVWIKSPCINWLVLGQLWLGETSCKSPKSVGQVGETRVIFMTYEKVKNLKPEELK